VVANASAKPLGHKPGNGHIRIGHGKKKLLAAISAQNITMPQILPHALRDLPLLPRHLQCQLPTRL
jgi:hypothetical protein